MKNCSYEIRIIEICIRRGSPVCSTNVVVAQGKTLKLKLITPQLITLCCKGGIMGVSLRHCVAFKREKKIMMHNLDSVFALKPLISLTFTRTQGRRNVSNFGGASHKSTIFDGVVHLYEANLGRANWPHWSMGSDTPGQHVGLRCPECTCNQNWT